MQSVSLALPQSYVSPLTSRSLGGFSSSSSQTEPTPPSDALQARLQSNALRAEAATRGVARSEAEERSAFLPTAISDLTSIETFLTAANSLALEASDTANLSTIQRAFLDNEFSGLLDDAQETAQTSEYDGTNLLDSARTVSFAVSDGESDGTELTVDLVSAQLDDLASGLSTANLSDDANVTAAADLLQDALSAVEGQINQLEVAEERVGTAREAQLANISGLNAAFQAQLEFQQAISRSQAEEVNPDVSAQIRAYLQIVALDFNEVSPAEASFQVHFDLQA